MEKSSENKKPILTQLMEKGISKESQEKYIQKNFPLCAEVHRKGLYCTLDIFFDEPKLLLSAERIVDYLENYGQDGKPTLEKVVSDLGQLVELGYIKKVEDKYQIILNDKTIKYSEQVMESVRQSMSRHLGYELPKLND